MPSITTKPINKTIMEKKENNGFENLHEWSNRMQGAREMLIKLYEDDKMIAINDVAPAAPVHVLLLPKEHTANITTAAPELVAYMLSKVKLIAEKTGMAEKGFRVVINTGDDGGQTVKHLHIHIIGGKVLGWPPC